MIDSFVLSVSRMFQTFEMLDDMYPVAELQGSHMQGSQSTRAKVELPFLIRGSEKSDDGMEAAFRAILKTAGIGSHSP